VRLRIAIIVAALGSLAWTVLDYRKNWEPPYDPFAGALTGAVQNTAYDAGPYDTRLAYELLSRDVAILTIAIVLFIVAPMLERRISASEKRG
jgi:hypothetical protein